MVLNSANYQIDNSKKKFRKTKLLFHIDFESFKQIIIKANLPNFSYPTSNGPINFGPAFHKDFLLEVLELQNNVKSKFFKNEIRKPETFS